MSNKPKVTGILHNAVECEPRDRRALQMEVEVLSNGKRRARPLLGARLADDIAASLAPAVKVRL